MNESQLLEELHGPKNANQETHPAFNREPGIAVIPGSPYAKEMAKFESFPVGGFAAGNPYKYRPFPKMLFRAERWNGSPACMAAPPSAWEVENVDKLRHLQNLAEKFTERCQMIVKDEREMQKAMESGWRESPAEAVEYLIQRGKDISLLDAHREYEDRNLSDAAKAEVRAERAERGGDPIPEMPEKRRAGRTKKTDSAA